MSEALNREYHEKLGWRIADAQRHPNDGYGSGFYKGHALLSPKGEERCFMTTSTPSKLWESLPNLHEDANLCIAELDRVFNPTPDSDGWLMESFKGRYRIMAVDDPIEGATFNEAALKALIAAHKRDGGET